MKKLVFILFAVLSLTFVNAQTTGQVPTYNSFSADGGVTDALLNYADGNLSENYSEQSEVNDPYIQGSPYTSNTFSPTPIYDKNEAVGQIFFRYNALNEEIEIMNNKVEGETIRSLVKNKELSIRPNGKKMSFKTFVTAENRTVNGYLTELVDGENFDLFKRIHVTFTEAKAAENTFTKDTPARFTKFIEFYVQKKGINRIDEVLPKKTKLLKLLADSKKEATNQFIKDNKLNLKNEADMIKVFEFLNK